MPEDSNRAVASNGWQNLLERQVTRKEFLTIIATGLTTIIGIGPLIELLTRGHHGQASNGSYGGGVYSGMPQAQYQARQAPKRVRIKVN